MIDNVEIDLLGRWEAGPGMDTPSHVMKSLLKNGILQEWFVPDAVMFQDEQQLIVFDPNNEKLVTKFDLEDIRDPTAFVKKTEKGEKQTSGFTKVLIFSVVNSGHFHFNNIFIAVQCLNRDPHQLVEQFVRECKLLDERERKQSFGQKSTASTFSFASVRRGKLSPPISYAEPDTKPAAVPVKSPKLDSSHATAQRTHDFGMDRPSFIYDRSEDQIVKDTILLNYCTEDIEKLCRELTNSRSNMENSRPIDAFQATEFTGVFQKFKLAFNLLVRLNLHISDPNACEVVHHLFPLLSFLMTAGSDLFGESLQTGVVSPLLTSQAITFLTHCLTSKEHQVWQACGPNWTLSRLEHHGDVVPYRPLFSDGWSPGYLDFPEAIPVPKSPSPSDKSGTIINQSGSVDIDSDWDDNSMISKLPGLMEDEREIFREKLVERKAEIALVNHSWNSNNNKELSVSKGEYLEILENSRKWWKCRNSENKIGYVPYTLLSALVSAEQVFNQLQSKKMEQELRNLSVRSPSQSPEPRSVAKSPKAPAPPVQPPPPPPQPKLRTEPPVKIEPVRQNRKRSNSIQSTASMQDELKNVLHYLAEQKSKQHIEILKTPDVYIDQRSTSREVKQWLKEKEFSARAVTKLDGLNGKQIMSMNRRDLEAIVGREEGARLDSQITLCRNNTKYTQGKNSELRAVLEKAKQRAEIIRRSEEDIDRIFEDSEISA